MESTFLSDFNHPRLNIIQCYYCMGTSLSNMFTQPVSPNLKIVYFLSIRQDSISFQLDFSKISTLKEIKFEIYGSKRKNSSITLNNDIANLENLELKKFSFTTTNLPVMDNFKKLQMLELYSYDPFDYSNIVTCGLASFVKIDLGTLLVPGSFPPFSLIPEGNNIENIDMIFSASAPSSMIDLTNLKNLKSFSIIGDFRLFNIGNEFPILPHPTLESIHINNGEFNDPKNFFVSSPRLTHISFISSLPIDFTAWKYSDFRNLLQLHLGNKFTGTIDESFCLIPDLFVRGNMLSGVIPSCFACYISQYPSNFDGNQFTNYPPAPSCTTILPNSWYNISEQTLYVYGKDIGISRNDISLSSPLSNYEFTTVTPSRMFKVWISKSIIPPKIEVVFKAKSEDGSLSQVFTVATAPTVPKVTNIFPDAVLKQLIIQGSYLSYNISSIKIKIGSSNCEVISATFYKVICSTSDINLFTETSILTKIAIDDNSLGNQIPPPPLSSEYIISMKSENKICVEDQAGCGSNTYCDYSVGSCFCKPGYQDLTSSGSCTLVSLCPNNCSGFGTCDTQTGICSCLQDRLGDDCSKVKCSRDCLNGGMCDESVGKCKCSSKFTGVDCSIQLHYVSSVLPCTINGGNVTLNGNFPESISSGYLVSVGLLNCPVQHISSNQIQCILASGSGIHNVIVTLISNSDVYFTGFGIFKYINPIKECPNNCTSPINGKCNTTIGQCDCSQDYSNYDCSLKKDLSITAPVVNTTVDKSGGVQMNSKETNYKISVISLNEISINGSIVASHSLQDSWVKDQESSENIYKFDQTIGNISKITYIIEEVKDEKEFQFGSTKFIVPKESIKISINISNYLYENSLNTLSLSFLSATTQENNKDMCNQNDASIDISNADNQEDANYIVVYKNSRQLVGRFINKVFSDNRETFISSSVDTNETSVIVSLNLPHCEVSCLIDPDFSVLVTPEFKSDCGINNKNNWLLSVVIVVPCVLLSLAILAAIVLYKKNRYNLKILSIKLKAIKNKK
ncbi:hypothetical protein DICPUDRAFT_82497 [Dictyostelium purpureum]|uniref:EGF-like domain-containing protein n=1 Tax=Dictyostelium purpureum TaxID=5786 RepID=F0ZWP7_DICPU|nr:uncharacterized protein DICPUDRAFT_82497 [Dictyostelium purpureum]EGC31636.1 hypothetical protein DICPUDRAFT_82497 [Dictyostelium purpureum]|eukprot:XP_003291834.1 hypothetical protein DICPUDRAFT_82497 [Dictyostelium purpureum]